VGWVAYVDESMRQRSDGEGIYVIAAAILDDEDAGSIRQRVKALARTRRSRIHWRDATEAERRKAVAAIVELEVLHLVVVGTRLNLRAQERCRRLCLRRLLWEVGAAGVGQVWLESRTASLNAKDYAAVEAWRAQHVVRGDLLVDFAQPFGPAGDQLLWLADIVAGAVSTARGDGDNQYLMTLDPLITEITIKLD
jgi:hypothetical protein